jgi:hypothetical protein
MYEWLWISSALLLYDSSSPQDSLTLQQWLPLPSCSRCQ